MESVRDLFGYILGLAFCLVAMALCAIAWSGLEATFGWRVALGGVFVSILMRLNFAVFTGLFFYASGILGWPLADSIGFAVPGLMLVTPGVTVAIFSFLVSTPIRR